VREGSAGISLAEVWAVLSKRKRLVFGFPALVAVISIIVAFLLPPIYTGSVRLLPPQQSGASASAAAAAVAALGQLANLPGLLGAPANIRTQADLYVGLLNSRTIADAIIERFELKKLYDEETIYDTRKVLAENTRTVAGRDGIILLEVEDKDPKRAAAMANAYAEELLKLTQTLAVTEAAQRRLFFERQLVSAKNDLANAEVALKKTQEATGLIKLDDQGRAIIETAARLQGLVAAKEVQLQAMRTFATDRNPEYVLIREELTGLREQLNRLEREKTNRPGDILVPTGRVPEAGLEYLRRLRDVKYQEVMFEVLAKQFELAKIDEARDVALVQIVDRAVEPDKRSKPSRLVIILLSTAVAFFVTAVVALVVESGGWARPQADG
jgi:uncharacterized protein involved in exopolysaccharide biosynthesis